MVIQGPKVGVSRAGVGQSSPLGLGSKGRWRLLCLQRRLGPRRAPRLEGRVMLASSRKPMLGGCRAAHGPRFLCTPASPTSRKRVS